MTLGSKPAFLSSALWSIFWEPGVDSNLVSPWCDPIVKVIMSLIDRDDLEVLDHLMALRRPNLAPLWYGVVACRQMKIIKAIVPFLERLQTPMPWRPIPEVAAWTTSPQYFMDLGGSCPYINQETGEVSRLDVWRLRHECWDAEPEGIFQGLREFIATLMLGGDNWDLRAHAVRKSGRASWSVIHVECCAICAKACKWLGRKRTQSQTGQA
ncbi:hypothetical protein B0H67DRAFT_89507 [Lasiosphaeris hirsuta]|uniref:Uncharacterized protein n=1 Tax=Lasiosphaeris hirsuta TaxID=260670 RepID=A0AA40EC18_9PEZI|nr:hypothetical protein B0H67DRAFT_89507 [Lasiosphaeris hirsuta]